MKTAVVPLNASKSPARAGPNNAPDESKMPRATFVLVNSRVVVHSRGKSAECTGLKTVTAMVATTASA